MSDFLKEECLCCGQKLLKEKMSFESSDVFICKNSCIFSTPKIDTNSIYDSEYFKNYYFKELNIEQSKMFKKLIVFLSRYIKKGSILDYGCGVGTFLATLEEKGFKQNVGIDISEYSISEAKSKVKNSSFYYDINELGSIKFDCISFVDSIAHIQDINNVISNLIAKNLKQDGYLLIRTPNINSLYIIYVRLIGFFFPKRFQSTLLFIPNRLFLFNKKSVTLFLNKFDMEIQDYFIEPEFSIVPSKFSNTNFFKSFIVHILRNKIPSFINPKNSITLIAKFKNE